MKKVTFLVGALVTLGLHLWISAAAGEKERTAVDSDDVYLIIQFIASDEGLDPLTNILADVSTDMASEQGFITATVYRDIDSPNRFTLVEHWASRALHEAHYEKIVENGAWAGILALLANEPRLEYVLKL